MTYYTRKEGVVNGHMTSLILGNKW